jgi:hypothetical protein
MRTSQARLQDLRNEAWRQVKLMGLAPEVIPGRAKAGRFGDGSTFIIRTAPHGSIVSRANNANWRAPMPHFERHDWCVIVRPVSDDKVEVYKIPTARLVADYKNHHKIRNGTTDMRALRFGGKPTTSGAGFGVHYQEFLLVPPAPTAERPSLVIHEGGPGDGHEMRNFSVVLETADQRVNKVLHGEPYNVIVYAYGIAGACAAGMDKATDKWLRHRNWNVTDWVVKSVYGEVASTAANKA